MRWNWRLLIPVGMLLLAGLACINTPPIPEVVRVTADSERPGTAYVVMDDIWYPASRDDQFYETTDYGVHWQESDYRFGSEQLNEAYEVTLSHCDIRINGQTVWTFPRQEYIYMLEISSFGLSDSLPCSRREVSLSYAISPADPETIYIAMGRNGVLIGPAPGTSELRIWHLSDQSLPIIPTVLSVSNIGFILFLIPAFSLVLLPAALVHVWAVQVGWQRFLGKAIGRRRYVWAGVLLGATLVLATVSAIFWMVNEDVSYRGMLVVATIITTDVSLIVTIRLARENESDGSFILKAMLFAAAVTPVVAILLVVSWWIPLPLLIMLLPVIYLGRRKQKRKRID